MQLDEIMQPDYAARPFVEAAGYISNDFCAPGYISNIY